MIAADIARYGLGIGGRADAGGGRRRDAGRPATRGAGPRRARAARTPTTCTTSGGRSAGVRHSSTASTRSTATSRRSPALRCVAGARAAAHGPASARVARLLYHSPFPKMAHKAHRRLLELDCTAATWSRRCAWSGGVVRRSRRARAARHHPDRQLLHRVALPVPGGPAGARGQRPRGTLGSASSRTAAAAAPSSSPASCRRASRRWPMPAWRRSSRGGRRSTSSATRA